MNERRRPAPQRAVRTMGPEYPEEASALRVTRTALSPRGKVRPGKARRCGGAEGVDGGAMHAIYQHRTDNEVPRRLPVVDDDANLSRSARTLRVTGTRFQGSPLRTRAMKKQRTRVPTKLDTSRDNLPKGFVKRALCHLSATSVRSSRLPENETDLFFERCTIFDEDSKHLLP